MSELTRSIKKFIETLKKQFERKNVCRLRHVYGLREGCEKDGKGHKRKNFSIETGQF
ncbi:MAG: hypothetical protein QXH91_07885 [Candidatus Bathyarchaeia archaeon]